MPGTFLLFFSIYPINSEHLCHGNYVREKTPEYMYILSVWVIMYGKHVREARLGIYYIYTGYARQLGRGCSVRCACALRVLCGYSMNIYYMYILYVEKFTEKLVRCARCTWGSVGSILYLYLYI